MGNNHAMLGGFLNILKLRMAWWFIPIITVLVLIGALIIVIQSSAVSPFIYALF